MNGLTDGGDLQVELGRTGLQRTTKHHVRMVNTMYLYFVLP